MNIRNYLKDWKKKVDEKLVEYLPPLDSYPETLSRAMSYSVLAGGKRIRPIMLLTVYRLCGGEEIDSIYPIACALEFIHTYSLIHDDLPAMDDDDFRRGQPSCHRKFGEDIAILAGDALFSHAFRVITESKINTSVKEKVLRVLTVATGSEGIIGGQVKDVESNVSIMNPGLLRYIHSHKTACFFSAICVMGGILAGVKDDKLDSLRRGGLYMGMTFQIIDDLLDVEGEKKELGKEVNKDKDKLTYPSLYGNKNSRRIAHRYSELAIQYLKPFDSEGIIEDLIILLLGRKK